VINSLAEIPGLRVITGIIILWIAMRLAWTTNSVGIKNITYKPVKSLARILFIVIVTDFTVCLDSVMITSELSSNPFFILVGIFLSVATVFMLFFSYSEAIIGTSWIQIIASGLIAHIAILDIIRDPLTEKPIIMLENFFEIEIHKWIHMFALDIAIIIVIIGIIKRIQTKVPFKE
jgi:predicted tellurium resistance membrane protein TerC